MLYIFYCIVPIFLLIVLGAFAKRCFIGSDDFWRGSEKITYYLFFPALLINALASAKLEEDMHNVIQPLILATLLLGIAIILLRKLIRIEKSRFTSYFQGSIRYNSYVFIGAASALYGVEALPIIAIIIAYMIIVTNVFSVIVLKIYASEEKPDLFNIFKGVIKNPLIISSLIGLLVNKFPFLYPKIISNFFIFLSNAALPINANSV